MPTPKPVRTYAEQIEDYPDDYLDCRVDRHSWIRVKVVDPFFRIPYGWPVYRECAKCGAIWSRGYNRSLTNKWFERRYYPPGYLLKGVGHSTAQRNLAFIRELIERDGTDYVDPDKG